MNDLKNGQNPLTNLRQESFAYYLILIYLILILIFNIVFCVIFNILAPVSVYRRFFQTESKKGAD